MGNFEVPASVAARLIERQGRLHAYEDYDPATTALLVVDMQNYFMAEGEPGCCPAAREIVPDVNRLAGAVRAAGGTVVWIQMEASEESLEKWANFHEKYLPEQREKRFRSLGATGEGYRLWPELVVGSGDEIVVKTRYSAFLQGSSDIEERLRSRGIETVLVAGVATNVCCESTARDCMMRGFRTIMVSDANAAYSEELHRAALLGFITVFGDVQSTDEVLERLRARAGSRSPVR